MISLIWNYNMVTSYFLWVTSNTVYKSFCINLIQRWLDIIVQQTFHFPSNTLDASINKRHNTDEGVLKKMVHPVVVILTSIKQVEVVPAILPANKVVFATHHKHHSYLQLSFKSTIATWNKEVTFSANKLVLRRVEVIESFCSTLLFFHKLK